MNNNKQTFTDLLRRFEQSTANRTNNEQEFANALQDLATACTYSVLKKLACVGGVVTTEKKHTTDSGRKMQSMKNDLFYDFKHLDSLSYAVNNATELSYTDDGEVIIEIIDKDLNKSIETLIKNTLSDSIDLVNTAVCEILKQLTKVNTTQSAFMEHPYNIRRLKRKVYIKLEDSKNGYETTTTTPIQEVYKAIRRDISSSRSIQANGKYVYIADVVPDTETDTETEVYKRLPKYSGLAYEMTDFNGKITGITADTETVNSTEKLIEKMNLNKRQADVLKLRLCGYGYKAIGTYLGVDVANIKRTVKQIQAKAANIGLTAE